ncbi:MAG TPA: 3-hydroxybutyryl-CoA dehydrogenase [Firmicutes bacterium]|nr:3-hydroxybutyryl-CoA dehydrogenase [Bacillota bacterium]
MEKVMVVGAGTMGSGIAQVVAEAGYPVVLADIEECLVVRGLARVKSNIEKKVSKGKLKPEEMHTILDRIQITEDVAVGKDCSLVIEAITEDLKAKEELFRKLDSICDASTIFASNTSTLSITKMASATKRPDKFIGLHFFNPAPVMALVEITKGMLTSDETLEVAKAFALSVGKSPVLVNEAPGFIVNRILLPMINEACYELMEGVASAEDIDAAMKLGANHPIGPLALADLIGLDVCVYIMEILHSELGEDKYRPCPLLRKMVRAGKLGRKTGEGFFKYGS